MSKVSIGPKSIWMGLALIAGASFGCGGPEKAIEDKLNESVLFFSNFEKGVDALWAEGDRGAQGDWARTRHHLNGGVVDGSVEFEKDATALSYAAKTSFAYSDGAWGGAVAFWMEVDLCPCLSVLSSLLSSLSRWLPSWFFCYVPSPFSWW